MRKKAHNFKDLSGQVINNWKIIEDTGKRNRRCPIWKCVCLKCNKEWEVSGNSIRNNSNKCRDCFNKTISGRPKQLNSEEEIKKGIFARYKIEARNRNLLFKLTFSEFLDIISKECFYCKKLNSNCQLAKNGEKISYNGIDRVDNTKGYLISNSVPCCKSCNTHKKSITPDMIKKAYFFLFGDKNV